MNARLVSVLIAALSLCLSIADASRFADDVFFHETFASVCVANPKTVRAVFENHFKQLNRCNIAGLKHERTPSTQVFLGKTFLKGQREIDEAYINFCKSRSKGGLRGLKYVEKHAFIVGNVISVHWVATAPFLAEPYYGSDAYVTCGGKMLTMVSTFDASGLKFKDGM